MGKLTTIGIPPGGSTGEVLKKKTGTNYDVEWGTGGGGGSGTVTSIGTTSPITGGTITTTGTIGITQATTSTDGYLSATDWNTFNGKQNALTNPVTGTGTSGQVTYWTGTNSVSASSNFTWDNTNGKLTLTGLVTDPTLLSKIPLLVKSDSITRLYIDSTGSGSSFNTGFCLSNSNSKKWSIASAGSTYDFTFYNETTLSYTLNIGGTDNNVVFTNNKNAASYLRLQNSNAGSSSESSLQMLCDGAYLNFSKYSSTAGPYKIIGNGDGYIYNSVRGYISIINDFASGGIRLASGGSSTAHLVISPVGNTLIGTTTDSGFKLDVNGTARVQGNLTISDAINVILGTTTGTKIGTSTSQKIGFFNATPIVQPSAVTTSQGIADALSSLGLLASSSISTTPDVGGKLYLFNSY